MSHRAALYTVRVKEKWKDYKRLGDIDEAGTPLAGALVGWLGNNFEVLSDDGEKLVRCTQVDWDEPELAIFLQHGESGIAADIVNQAGALRLRQTADDTQLLRCAGLFHLPPDLETGWLALHVNYGRGVKGLLEIGLLRAFNQAFTDLLLQINPYVEAAAFYEAIDAGRVEKIHLTKWVRPQDRAVTATDRWLPNGAPGKLSVTISPRLQVGRLRPAPLRRFTHANPQQRQRAFDEIVEFQGVQYDAASVEVELENGTKRTFNIEQPSSGHPMTVDLTGLDFAGDGEPTEASVLNGLRDALATVR
jgi:hypothetical protein